jgi:hypothetical protein
MPQPRYKVLYDDGLNGAFTEARQIPLSLMNDSDWHWFVMCIDMKYDMIMENTSIDINMIMVINNFHHSNIPLEYTVLMCIDSYEIPFGYLT